MSDLTSAQRQDLEQDLRNLEADLRSQIESARDGAKPVDLDEPIGRLSRMDAIQQQSIVQANLRAAQQRLALVGTALRRFAQDEYGECVACGEPVGIARLKARPETPFCLACQTSREASR